MHARAGTEMVDKLNGDEGPRRRDYRPTFRDDCVRLTLMSEAIADSSLGEGDSVTQYYYDDEGLLVIDLPGTE